MDLGEDEGAAVEPSSVIRLIRALIPPLPACRSLDAGQPGPAGASLAKPETLALTTDSQPRSSTSSQRAAAASAGCAEHSELQQGGAACDAEAAREEAGCLLWDLSADLPAAQLMLRHAVLDILVLVIHDACSRELWRLVEVCTGILANLACHASLAAQLAGGDLLELVIGTLWGLADAAALGETYRLTATALRQGGCGVAWVAALTMPPARGRQLAGRLAEVASATLVPLLLERALDVAEALAEWGAGALLFEAGALPMLADTVIAYARCLQAAAAAEASSAWEEEGDDEDDARGAGGAGAEVAVSDAAAGSALYILRELPVLPEASGGSSADAAPQVSQPGSAAPGADPPPELAQWQRSRQAGGELEQSGGELRGAGDGAHPTQAATARTRALQQNELGDSQRESPPPAASPAAAVPGVSAQCQKALAHHPGLVSALWTIFSLPAAGAQLRGYAVGALAHAVEADAALGAPFWQGGPALQELLSLLGTLSAERDEEAAAGARHMLRLVAAQCQHPDARACIELALAGAAAAG